MALDESAVAELLAAFDAGEGTDLVRQLDLDRIWQFANEQEQRTLLDELLDNVAVHPDHLEVAIHGAPRLDVQFSEVGLKHSQISGVGGGT